MTLAGCRDSAVPPSPLRADANAPIPIQEQYHSITGRVRPGMSMAHARALAGDCTRGRFHGPLTDMSTGVTTYHEEWAWVVDASNGMIVIHSTTGLESDLEKGIVSNVSFSAKHPVHVESNGVKTANNTSEHIP